jgi:hypothetical protein
LQTHLCLPQNIVARQSARLGTLVPHVLSPSVSRWTLKSLQQSQSQSQSRLQCQQNLFKC